MYKLLEQSCTYLYANNSKRLVKGMNFIGNLLLYISNITSNNKRQGVRIDVKNDPKVNTCNRIKI